MNYPSAHDVDHYRIIAASIGRVGVFGGYVDEALRTYAYPLVILHVKHVADFLGLPWGFAVFEAQLIAYLTAARYLRSKLDAVFPEVAPVVFVGLCINPLPLLYTVETLAESLSISLFLIAAASLLRLWSSGDFYWRAILIGSLGIGFAVMVRPANLFAVPAWLIGVAYLTYSSTSRRRWTFLAIILGTVLVTMPMVPQLANNVRHFQRWTPLVVTDLGKFQQDTGIRLIKYASAVPPVPVGAIKYTNPLMHSRPLRGEPLSWYVDYPLAGITTAALHTFGMLDQDLLFTYSADLDPWYRPLVGVVNHGVVALAVVGLVLITIRARRSQAARAFLLIVSAFLGSHVLLHSTTAVEMRFGLPLLVVAGPVALWSSRELSANATIVLRTVAALFVIAWVVASLALSSWMRNQSIAIKAWGDEERISRPNGRGVVERPHGLAITGGGMNAPANGRITGWVLGRGFHPSDLLKVDGVAQSPTFAHSGHVTFSVDATVYAARYGVIVEMRSADGAVRSGPFKIRPR